MCTLRGAWERGNDMLWAQQSCTGAFLAASQRWALASFKSDDGSAPPPDDVHIDAESPEIFRVTSDMEKC